VFTIRLARFGPAILFSSPAAAKEILEGDPETFRAGKTKFMKPFLGDDSLLCLDGEQHLRHRRLLTPPFHGPVLGEYAHVIAEIAERELRSWPSGRAFSLEPWIRRITLAAVLRNVFGVESGERSGRLGRLLAELMSHAGAGVLGLVRFTLRRDLGKPPSPRTKLGRLLDAVDAAIRAEIDDRRRAGSAGRPDVLSLLLAARDERGDGMSDGEVRDELVTMLLAGHETTTASLEWAFERLLRHPAAWERLCEEAREGMTDEYTRAVVRETLRVRPVFLVTGRRPTQPTEIAGHHVPAGTLAYACIYLTHTRDDLYEDPHSFRPERFLAPAAPAPYSWIPFGGGRRRCIGAAFAELEMRVILRAVAAHARLDAPDPSPEPLRRRGVVIAPGRGAMIRLTQRI
jgi:cytochrome P450